MNWKNKKEIRTDLFILIGLVILIMGFIDLLGLFGWNLIIAGIIVLGIGVNRALKDINLKNKKIKRRRK